MQKISWIKTCNFMAITHAILQVAKKFAWVSRIRRSSPKSPHILYVLKHNVSFLNFCRTPVVFLVLPKFPNTSKWPSSGPLYQNAGLHNPLTPNDHYSGRTAPLTSKRCILYIYSTNIGTEYFKHGIYFPFFFSSKYSLFHNSNVFVSRIMHILYTGCFKLKK